MNVNYEIATTNGFGCAICGAAIRKGDKYVICPDCAAVFCKTCCEDGTFESHSCEELEEEFAGDLEEM